MTITPPPSASPCPNCPICNQQGLPILPVRYALARSDMGNAPRLAASFGDDAKSIALPADTAHYTLRLLRSGFLYMYDEGSKEWRGYVVDEQSYLREFDVYAKAPPKFNALVFKDACKAQHAPAKARCIILEDAAYATHVCLSFSDVAWTRAVLEKHATPEYRHAHMQRIDVAAWRNRVWQPHVATFDMLSQIAEFAADGPAMKEETLAYVTRYLPAPYRSPEELLRDDAKTQKAVSMTSGLFTDLLRPAVQAPVRAGPVASAAWAFSSQPFYMAQDEAVALAAWGTQAARPLRATIVALPDPAGIAMDINRLALQRSLEFTDEPQRKSKYETALTITALSEAVKNGAVKTESETRKQLEEMTGGYEPDTATFGILRDWLVQQNRLEPAGALSDADQQAAGDAVWPKYTRYFKAAEWESYLSTDTDASTNPATNYHAAFEEFSRTTLAPLDLSYLAWLQSDALHAYFSHNYDPLHLESGQAYTDLATALIQDAGGRPAVFNYLQAGLTQNPDNAHAWLMRALALNHDPLIRGWTDEALKAATTSDVSWVELAEKFHDKFKEVITEGAEGEKKLDAVARYIYQLTGPMLVNLSEAINAPLAVAVEKNLSAKFQMGMLGTVARVGNPNLVLVDLRGEWTRKQATRILANLLGKLSGTHAAEYRSAARGALDDAAHTLGERYPFRAITLVDKAKAEKLAGLSGAARGKAVADLLTPVQFDEIFQESVGKLGNLNVKAGFIQMLLSTLSAAISFGELMKAKPEQALRKKENLAAGAAGLFGGMMETAGSLFKNTAWGARLSRIQFKFFAIEVTSTADWLIAGGKILGAFGSGLAGFLQILEASEMSKNHPNLKTWTNIAGYASIFMAVLTIGVTGISGFSFLIGILIAVVTLVVAWLKPNSVQNWLEQSQHFGAGKILFNGPVSQALALEAIVKGD